jgi:hypothetical protein
MINDGSYKNFTQTERLNRLEFLLVEKRKGEWYVGTVNVFADFPPSLLMQDDTNNRVYQQNTKHVKKTNTTIKRKAQKTMNWKTNENG